jgi:hypothetical protein
MYSIVLHSFQMPLLETRGTMLVICRINNKVWLFNTFSPGRIETLRSPMPGHFKRTEKKFEMCGISFHNNMKILHAIAEACISCTRKWNSYVYFEPDTTVGNFEIRIRIFIVTTSPLQFTHCADIRFLWHCLWNSIVTFTSSNSVLSDTLQKTAL